MLATHEVPIVARCPVNQGIDTYVCTIAANRIVKVEDIWQAITSITTPMFQEDLTVRLAFLLNCKVTTVGWHSGIKTTVTEGDATDVYERGNR